ncbi:MAG: zincin-like metallopeptidase domain-containing protein, partial [Prevotella sp.]
DSDAKGCKSNLFTQFSEAKARGESVREHEKGVPFLFYNWNKYVNRNNPDDVITKEAYAEMLEQDKQQYKGVKNREIRVLFNIDQTLLPMANETAYTTTLKKEGTTEDRGYGDKEDKQLHGRVSGFLQKMKDNLVNVRQDGTGVAHYDTEKDVIYLPRQRDFEHYNDYVQEMMRQLVSATGHQQRLAREGMVMKNGKAPSEDAVKKERLITEIASGVKMLELGLPARLSKDSLSMVDYWTRELKEDPCLIDAIESEVNGALKVLKKAELGEKVEYATDQHQRETAQIQVQLPNHYFVADEIKQHPNEEQRTVVIVRDDASKTADVVLPQGASLEVNNEIKGMNKQRFTNALQKEGYDNVRFYNPDGALGFRPDDSYFADKKITVSRLRNWSIEDLSSLDATEAVTHSRDIGFDNVQLVKDDKERWALYIKPEGKEGFAVYPDKGDLNHFFTTLKQSMDNIERVREELAHKYYAMAEAKPDLKVDIFGGNEQEVDLNRIQRVAVFRVKSGECLCAATIDGKKLQPRSVSPSQWQRLWVAPDRDSYKQNLAASLFADVLQKDNNVEQSTQEKQEEAKEVKQAETATVEKHDEQKEMAQQEDKPSDQKEQASEQREEKKEEKKEDKAVKAAISPLVQQYLDLKKKHPDAILLFRCGDFYETYKDDAVKASNILGITLTKSNGRKDDEGKPLAMAGFPYHALDTYLPKLIRAGERVAICDQLEMPKQTTSSKRGIAEMVTPGQETGKQMAQESQGTGQHTSLRR